MKTALLIALAATVSLCACGSGRDDRRDDRREDRSADRDRGSRGTASIERELEGVWVPTRFTSCEGDIIRYTFESGGEVSLDGRQGSWSVNQDGDRDILTVEAEGSRQSGRVEIDGDRMEYDGGDLLNGSEFRRC